MSKFCYEISVEILSKNDSCQIIQEIIDTGQNFIKKCQNVLENKEKIIIFRYLKTKLQNPNEKIMSVAILIKMSDICQNWKIRNY